MNTPLISICIPTKNRASSLDRCLNAIFSSAHYDSSLIEVVVSDNASTDETPSVVEKYLKQQNSLIYNRNKENLGVGGELNFIKVLSLGHGKLLRFLNDYTILNDDGIKVMLCAVRDYENEKFPLLFVTDSKKSYRRETTSLGELLLDARENFSWIMMHSYWKESWDALQDKTARIDSMYMQIDWFLRLTEQRGKAIVFHGPYSKTIEPNRANCDYNWFKVQMSGLIDFYVPYVDTGKISKRDISKFKKIIYKSRLSAYKYWYFVKSVNTAGSSYSVLPYFYETFKDCSWFYIHFPFYILKLYVKKWIGYWWIKRNF